MCSPRLVVIERQESELGMIRRQHRWADEDGPSGLRIGVADEGPLRGRQVQGVLLHRQALGVGAHPHRVGQTLLGPNEGGWAAWLKLKRGPNGDLLGPRGPGWCVQWGAEG